MLSSYVTAVAMRDWMSNGPRRQPVKSGPGWGVRMSDDRFVDVGSGQGTGAFWAQA